MPIYLTTPTNITPGTAGSWQSVDITAHVGGFAGQVKVAHLRCINAQGGTAHVINVRATGSTDDRQTSTITADSHYDRWVGVDANDTFDAIIDSTTWCFVYLVSYYIDGEADFLVNAVDVVPTSGAWNDVNVSAHTTGTALAACLEVVNPAASVRKYALRKNGSTDDRSARNIGVGRMLGAIAPLDGSEIFEAKVDSAVQLWFSCYLLDNVVFFDNASAAATYSVGTTDTYESKDMSADIPDGANGAFLHWYADVTPRYWASRPLGKTYDLYFRIEQHCYTQSEISSARVIELKANQLTMDTYLLGYTISAAEDETGSITGNAATGSPGDLVATGGADLTLGAVSATGAVGTFTVITEDGVSLTGVQATGAIGTLTANADTTISITGVEATGSPGTLDVLAGAIVDLTGVGATSAVGDLAVELTSVITVEGVSAAGEMGLFGYRIAGPPLRSHTSVVARTPQVSVYERHTTP